MKILTMAAALCLVSAFAVPAHSMDESVQAFCDTEDCVNTLRHLERRANHGSTLAAIVVATAYANGDGVEQDSAKAVRLLRRAANRGDPASELLISNWYREGVHLAQNSERADMFLARAVGRDYNPALKHQAMLWLQQETPELDAKAIALLEQASAQAHVPSQYFLAQLYMSGVGTDVDLVRAGTLLRNLAISNYKDAQVYLKQVIAALDNDDAVSEEYLASLTAAFDVERIEVFGGRNSPEDVLGFIESNFRRANIYNRPGTGTRIIGRLCGEAGPASNCISRSVRHGECWYDILPDLVDPSDGC